TAVNNASFQVSRRHQLLRTTDQVGPGINIAGLVQFGRPYAGNNERTEDHYEFLNTTTVLRGRHLLKFGVDLDHIRESASVGDGFGGYYIFPSLDAFLNGTPDQYLQSWGSPNTRFAVTKYAGFFQDHWTVSKRFTIDAGLRYEFERLPVIFRKDANNVAPRIGVAF